MLWSHATNQTLETLTLHGRSLMPTKQSMCSSDNLPLLGSRCLEEHLKKKRCVNNSDFLPAFYHEEPTGLVVQPTHTAHPVAIIDLTPGSGYWAVESVRNKVAVKYVVVFVFANIRSASQRHRGNCSSRVVLQQQKQTPGLPSVPRQRRLYLF